MKTVWHELVWRVGEVCCVAALAHTAAAADTFYPVRDQAILHDGKTFRGLDDKDVIEHWTGDGKRKWAKEKQVRWLEDGRIYDNWGFNGCDGIIYADMEPKEQFWRVKKAYSAAGR